METHYNSTTRAWMTTLVSSCPFGQRIACPFGKPSSQTKRKGGKLLRHAHTQIPMPKDVRAFNVCLVLPPFLGGPTCFPLTRLAVSTVLWLRAFPYPLAVCVGLRGPKVQDHRNPPGEPRNGWVPWSFPGKTNPKTGVPSKINQASSFKPPQQRVSSKSK